MRVILGGGLKRFSKLSEKFQRDQMNMALKHVLLILMVLHLQNIASSHILTSAFVDMSLPACTRSLTQTVMNDLCPTYGDYSSEYMPPIVQELALMQLEHKENIIKECCQKPCTLTELMAIC